MAGRDRPTFGDPAWGGVLDPNPRAKRIVERELSELTGTSTRSPLTDTFPTFFQLRMAASRIPAPANTLPPLPTGELACFPLINEQASSKEQQDLLLCGVHTVLGSTGNTDAQGLSPWGDATGAGAAIVVGVDIIPNLKAADGLNTSWTSATPPVPWVDPLLQTFAPTGTGIVFATPFAPGNRATANSRVDAAEDFPPHVVRLRRTSRVQAAFVLPAARANTARTAQAPFACLIELRLRLGRTFTSLGLASE